MNDKKEPGAGGRTRQPGKRSTHLRLVDEHTTPHPLDGLSLAELRRAEDLLTRPMGYGRNESDILLAAEIRQRIATLEAASKLKRSARDEKIRDAMERTRAVLRRRGETAS